MQMITISCDRCGADMTRWMYGYLTDAETEEDWLGHCQFMGYALQNTVALADLGEGDAETILCPHCGADSEEAKLAYKDSIDISDLQRIKTLRAWQPGGEPSYRAREQKGE
jgi:hypothetical protein